ERRGMNVKLVLSSEQAVESFYDLRPDCVLTHDRGFATLRALSDKAQAGAVPVFALCADPSKATLLEAYRLGASDAMARPLDMEEFLVRLQNKLQSSAVVRRAMLVDELTGVYNRKYLSVEMNRLLGS